MTTTIVSGRRAPSCLRPLAEAMEARILHSADLAPLALADAAASTVGLLQAAPADAAVQRSEIVFIDAAVTDADSLRADLQAQRSAGRPVEIVVLAAGEDGLARIGATLAERSDIAAIHVLAHGSDGRLQLGSITLDAQTLLARAGEVAGWSRSLAAGADLLLYGCDLARTEVGQHLLDDLAALTGADVAASTDLTGAAEAGRQLDARIPGRPHRGGARAQRLGAGQLARRARHLHRDQHQRRGGRGAAARHAALGHQPGQCQPGADTIVFSVNGTFNIAGRCPAATTTTPPATSTSPTASASSATAAGNTVINGNGLDRVFDVRSGTVTFSGLTIQGGASNTGAGLRIGNTATVTLTDVVVQNNVGKGASKGAGIYDDGSLTLRRVLVQNNGNTTSGDADGAGIYHRHRRHARRARRRDQRQRRRQGQGRRRPLHRRQRHRHAARTSPSPTTRPSAAAASSTTAAPRRWSTSPSAATSPAPKAAGSGPTAP